MKITYEYLNGKKIKLGSGGQTNRGGEGVFLGKYEEKKVAIKRMLAAKDQKAIESEYALKFLRHNNIVRLFAIAEERKEGPNPYLYACIQLIFSLHMFEGHIVQSELYS